MPGNDINLHVVTTNTSALGEAGALTVGAGSTEGKRSNGFNSGEGASALVADQLGPIGSAAVLAIIALLLSVEHERSVHLSGQLAVGGLVWQEANW